MSAHPSQEVPLVFECAGQELLGIAHVPSAPAPVGIVVIIAGGPQYRAGVGRGMVSMARELCVQGIPVLRFDHRGLGDSAGEFLGFEHIGEDIQAAVDAFRARIPGMEKVVIWGGCDAASAAMMHGWKIPQAASLIVANPWVYTHEVQTTVMRRHYFSRLQERSFWLKVLRFEYNLLAYLRSGLARLVGWVGRKVRAGNTSDVAADPSDATGFVGRMLEGLRRFEGPVLFLMSGQSMLTREFDELVSSDPGWKAAYSRAHYHRVDFPEADQTFSTQEAREQACGAIRDWMLTLYGNR